MLATTARAAHPSLGDTRGQLTLLLALSVPIMALYTSDAVDYATMLFKDQPTEVAVELAAPAEMTVAMKNVASLPDTPALAFDAPYFNSDAPSRSHSGTTTLASAATSAIGGFSTSTVY